MSTATPAESLTTARFLIRTKIEVSGNAFPDDHTCHASMGGIPKPAQPELTRIAAARTRVGSEITVTDSDAACRKPPRLITQAAEISAVPVCVSMLMSHRAFALETNP